MTTLPWLIAFSTGWFLLLLLFKSASGWKFCVACVATGSTWMALLIIRAAGVSFDPLFIGILMGESIVGLYYLLEKRLDERWHIFRWPYLITTATAAYLTLGSRDSMMPTVAFIVLMWLAFGAVYAARHTPAAKKIADRLIACCRDW